MKHKLIQRSEREWVIASEDGSEVGEVSRKQTGYLVRKYSATEPVKRFRLIDALNEAFGTGHEFDLPETTKPTEEGYV